MLTPFHGWVESEMGRPNLAALISVVVTGLVVPGLASFVGQRLIQEASKGVTLLTAKVESGDWRRAIEARPRIAFLAVKIEREAGLVLGPVILTVTVVLLEIWRARTATEPERFS